MSFKFLLLGIRIFWPNVKNRLSRSIEIVPEMRVDRPFVFMVFDEVTGLVLCSTVVNSIQEGGNA